MFSNTLCPPNLDALSDDVIGTVTQRQFLTAGFNTARVSVGHQFAFERHATVLSRLPHSTLTHLSYRERQRIYKQRYRKKQQIVHDDLEGANTQLRQEIKQLQSRLRGLSIARHSALWSVATDYFNFFQHGLHTRNGTPTAQLNFLRLLNVGVGTVLDTAAIARNLSIFTHFFQDVDVQLQRLEKIADSAVVGTTTTSFTLTRCSLMNAFPHLFYGSTVRGVQRTESRGYRLVLKLLDQRLVVSGSVRFDRDNLNNRVVRISSQIDLVSALLQLLGNVEDVSFVFNGARITPEGNVVGELPIPSDDDPRPSK
ncbi:hypothetical protein PC129_g9619 [Phytophthora cactorum]|uniref:BZIP domain-containing protein n=2 Tax=Phytophthora cactorum TaxID=29920 RepID=A0A329RR72_9STRA|nr:hypothetical protein Pcac1_g6774 [Phytophthora cactorum]KAG2831061.1 hypothetical protein PC112_g7446 [Phytophthora cactorum]KAG2833577.1 hypothetical protein PC111_g6170 [Phytophthora cactorum]KAG2861093.1 hypothetical protein PC113_g7475 [Phytophthora cactorum]KAG2912704.1 hypothetical protein PC114_g8820 [Phytophthora cactorum]